MFVIKITEVFKISDRHTRKRARWLQDEDGFVFYWINKADAKAMQAMLDHLPNGEDKPALVTQCYTVRNVETLGPGERKKLLDDNRLQEGLPWVKTVQMMKAKRPKKYQFNPAAPGRRVQPRRQFSMGNSGEPWKVVIARSGEQLTRAGKSTK